MFRSALILVTALTVGGQTCSVRPLSFDDPYLNKNEEYIRSLINEATLIFWGVVQEVGEPPNFVGMHGVTRQTVTYKVEEILVGEVSLNGSRQVSVQHMVVPGSRYATKHRQGKIPTLSPDVFHQQAQLVVMVRKGPIYAVKNGKLVFTNGKPVLTGWMWEDFGETLGTIPASTQNLNRIRELISQRT